MTAFGQKRTSVEGALFSFLKKGAVAPKLKLFYMTVHVSRGSSEMPANLAGAYVPMFVGADDHEAAVVRAVRKLQAQGYEFLDLADDHTVRELDPTAWDQYVKDAWPEFVREFPAQKSVLAQLEGEFLFTGPFLGYEPQRT